MAQPSENRLANRLSREKSPYLRQHAANPVDWYPWGEEAFARAREENKPIFLSIGYSTCHWCHVMAHESFEDAEVASLLNQTFVCIKVDREERPDIDHIFMNVCQIQTGGGGWPLSIFLLPDRRPFFAGTYFPRHSRFGRVGMIELIGRINEALARNPGQLEKAAEDIVRALQQVSADAPPDKPLTSATLDLAFRQFAGAFDRELGGFGKAPKFPTPHNLVFLLRYGHRADAPTATAMAEKTLLAMRRGGICDQIGFGFHRYSVDSEWLVPHFEKMLYDQALLAYAYCEAYKFTRHPEWAETARQIFTYVLRDLRAPQGTFYSAEDADTEGEEGRYYVWTEAELAKILSATDLQILKTCLTVTEQGNFVEIGHHATPGRNVLAVAQPPDEAARQLGLTTEQLRSQFEEIRLRLFTERLKRQRPHRDEKILTDWNGLMIAALAKASWTLAEPAYLDAAATAARRLLTDCRDADGGLLHRTLEGESGIRAHLDDYAFLIWGLLELYEATLDVFFLQSAKELMDYAIAHFADREHGAFFFTSDLGEPLLIRSKEIYDGATPSGNSVMAANLLRLGRLTGNPSFEALTEQLFKTFSQKVGSVPMVHAYLLTALDLAIGPMTEIVIVGRPQDAATHELVDVVRRDGRPNQVVLLKNPDDATLLESLAPYTQALSMRDGKPTAYVCQQYQCSEPTTDPAVLAEQVRRLRPSTTPEFGGVS